MLLGNSAVKPFIGQPVKSPDVGTHTSMCQKHGQILKHITSTSPFVRLQHRLSPFSGKYYRGIDRTYNASSLREYTIH